MAVVILQPEMDQAVRVAGRATYATPLPASKTAWSLQAAAVAQIHSAAAMVVLEAILQATPAPIILTVAL